MIFDARRFPSGRPGHSAACDADVVEFAPMYQDTLVDAGDFFDKIDEDAFGANGFERGLV